MIKSGKVKSKADLARQVGISRARLAQIMNLLKMDEETINEIEDLRDFLNSKFISKR